MSPSGLHKIVGAMLGGRWSTRPAYGSGSLREIESTERHPDGANIGVAEDVRGDDAHGIVALRNHADALLEIADAVKALRDAGLEGDGRAAMRAAFAALGRLEEVK